MLVESGNFEILYLSEFISILTSRIKSTFSFFAEAKPRRGHGRGHGDFRESWRGHGRGHGDFRKSWRGHGHGHGVKPVST